MNEELTYAFVGHGLQKYPWGYDFDHATFVLAVYDNGHGRGYHANPQIIQSPKNGRLACGSLKIAYFVKIPDAFPTVGLVS